MIMKQKQKQKYTKNPVNKRSYMKQTQKKKRERESTQKRAYSKKKIYN